MTQADWEEAVARALVERAFRVRLLADPADALGAYGLSADEQALLQNLRAPTLEQLVVQLPRRLPYLLLASHDVPRFGV